MPPDAETAPPQIIILAGPNGAGKTTVHASLLPPAFTFINADNIARELRDAGASSGPATDLAAGRLLIDQMEALTRARRQFCIETNLANRTLAARIPRWQAIGYKVALYYLRLESVELAIARVALRVRSGGHDVPEPTMRRRYQQGLQNFLTHYVPLVDRWHLYDSSPLTGPVLLERGTSRIVAHMQEDTRADDQRTDAAMRHATQEALREHKRRGRAVPTCRDGKVILIAPQDLEVSDENPAGEAAPSSTASHNQEDTARDNHRKEKQ